MIFDSFTILRLEIRQLRLALFLFFGISISHAQEITLSGTVNDKSSDEPVPFANVYIQRNGKTLAGTTTSFEGYYRITIPEMKSGDSIIASAVGYTVFGRRISNGRVEYDLELLRASVDLTEVVIIAGEDPAKKLLRNVVERKEKNNYANIEQYYCETYNKVEIDIDDISDKWQNNRLFKPFDFIWNNIDSITEDKPFLPIFLTETLSDYYYERSPKKEREIIKASKISGIKNESVSQILGNMYFKFNVYDEWFNLMGQTFVSPISNSGSMYYKYILIDSAWIDGRMCYKMLFSPKRKIEDTFIGDFWVDKETFAMVQLSMKIADHSNINFIDRLTIFQTFSLRDKNWVLDKDKLIIDFETIKNTPSMIGRRIISYDKFIFTDSITQEVDQKVNVELDDSIYKLDESYWQSVRHDTLSENESAIYELVDKIQSVRAYRTYVDLIQLAITGYKVWGNVEIGPYQSIISGNEVEGFRVKLGGRTSNQFSTRWMFGGYVAYGFKDKDYKYGFETMAFLDKRPRQTVGFTYKNDLNSATEDIDQFGDNNTFSGVFRRNIPMRLTKIEEYKTYHFKEWRTGLSIKTIFSVRNINPYTHSSFIFRFPDFSIFKEIGSTIKTTDIRFSFRYANQEKFIAGEFDRISLGSRYPILKLIYTHGLKGVLDGQFEYQKLELNVEDRIKIPPFGYFKYFVAAGKIFNDLPFLLLESHRANETYYYIDRAFNNIRRYEFVNDIYVTAFASQHFHGYFLDKIPLLRKLKWRSLLTFKTAWGDMTTSNKIGNSANNILSPSKHPYCEGGLGVENIFKIIRIDAIWRLNYLDVEHANAFRFGLRGSFQLNF